MSNQFCGEPVIYITKNLGGGLREVNNDSPHSFSPETDKVVRNHLGETVMDTTNISAELTVLAMRLEREMRELEAKYVRSQANLCRTERERDEARIKVAELERTCEILRDTRDRYRRMAGLSSDWETSEKVREKFSKGEGE